MINNKNAKLLEQALQLKDKLKNKKRDKRLVNLWNSFELDKNGFFSSKSLIEKLTGNKKFEVDEKMDQTGVITFIESITEKHSDEENELLDKIEAAIQGNTVYKEDLENPLYLKIVNYFKELKKANKEAAGKK